MHLPDALGFTGDVGAYSPHRVGIERAVKLYDKSYAMQVWAAAYLEGNPFTYPEIQTVLEGVSVAGHKLSDLVQIMDLRDAVLCVKDRVNAGIFRMDKATSDALNAAIAVHEALEAGHFRGEGAEQTNVAVNLGEHGSYTPPSTQDGGGNLRMRFREVTDALADVEDPYVQAVLYGAAATREQFYFDGNKRTARFMVNGLLMAAGYSPVVLTIDDIGAYNDAVTQLFVRADVTALAAVYATAHQRDLPPVRDRDSEYGYDVIRLSRMRPDGGDGNSRGR